MSQDPPRKRGRPPSRAARRKALQAAHEILMQDGFGRLTVEAVAARSGVGKPTIYRNWANASELAMAALMEALPEPGDPDGRLAPALKRLLTDLVQAFATTRGRQIALALAAGDPDSEMARAFRNRVVLSSREAGRGLIDAAAARGEIAPPGDAEVVLDMIFAPIVYRLLIGHRPLDPGLGEALATRAMDLLDPRRPAG